MSFRENLINLRKEKGMSQEQLADQLDVTRQTIYKWESEQSYPEMNKLLELCKIFNVSLDDLVKGTVNSDERMKKAADKSEYLARRKKNLFNVSIGVSLILLGVAAMLCIIGEGESDFKAGLGVGSLLVTIAIATVIFISTGTKYEAYMEDIDLTSVEFSKEEKLAYAKRSGILVSIGVAIILVSIAVMILLLTKFEDKALFIVAGFMMAIGIAVFMFINAGSPIDDVKDQIKIKNNANSALTGKICGFIMILATIVFLFCGLSFELWDKCWIAFPIGGLFCGAVSVLLNKEAK